MAKHPPGKEQVERYFASVEALVESVDSWFCITNPCFVYYCLPITVMTSSVRVH